MTEAVRAAPRARALARELGIDLSALSGSGPGGAITVADVEAAAATAEVVRQVPAARLSGGEVSRQERMRQAIAAAMARSKREIPHYYVATTIDLGRALEWLQARNAERSVTERLLPVALFVRSVALAAREMPGLNGTWEGGRFRPGEGVHVGVVVSLRAGGLMVPVIRDADGLGLDALMAALRGAVSRARSGSLRSSEVGGATITVTSLGEGGAEEVFGVIHPPQVALVGFGRVVERPWVAGGSVGVRPVVRATLSADHRATDGHAGARFLNVIDRLLQTPEELT